MKKTMKFIGLIAMAAVLFSCEKKVDPVNDTPKNPEEQGIDLSQFDPSEYLVSFGATIEDSFTKATVSIANGAVAFENGDEVLVVSGLKTGIYTYSSSAFSPKAADEAVPLGEDIYAYYPSTAYTVDETTGSVTFKLPEGTTSVEVLGDKNPMAAKLVVSGESASAGFKNFCSILQVSITGNNTLSKVSLSNTTAPLIANAAYSVNWSADSPSISAGSSTDNTSEITSDATLTPDTPAVFYFLLPAGASLEKAIVTAELRSNHNGGTNSFSVTRGDWTPEANKIYKMSFYAGLFSGGAGTTGDPYKIANARDFKYISKYCAEGYGSKDAASFLGATYKQTAAIDFKGADLSTYMIASASAPFTGTYDGQSDVLTKFSISGTEECTGLWRVTSGATLKNIKVTTATVTSTAGTVGSLVGRAENGLTLDSCISTATVTASGKEIVGGLVGLSTGGMTIKGCVNQGDVTGANYTGGLVGYINTEASSTIGKNSSDMPTNNRGTVSGNSAVGGIVGETTGDTTITDGTYNAGNITGSGQNIGGLVGRQNKEGYVLTINGGSSNGIPVIENPSPQIIIKSTRADAADSQSNVGGLVGMVESGTIAISDNCFNRGNVTGSAMYAGGIVGQIKTAGCTISDCVNYGEVKTTGTKNSNNYTGGILGCSAVGMDATIVSCTNNGDITSTKTFVGGIAGRFFTGTIDLCVNAGNINGTATNANNVGGITGGIYTATVKRCYSAKGKTVEGGARVAGIVGILEQGGKVISCASYSYIEGHFTNNGSVNNNIGIGFIVGVENNDDALIANCVALWDKDDTKDYSLNSGKSAENKVTGGLVGSKIKGKLQNSYCQVPCNKIGFVYNTSGTVVRGHSTATNGKPNYIGQVVGRNIAGDIVDCYYGGWEAGSTTGVRPVGTRVAGTPTNVTRISSSDKVAYDHASFVPVAVTTSTGAEFVAGTVYLKNILDGGLTSGTITGYTPAEGEVLTWSNLSASDYTPIPTAILGLYNATEN